MGGDKPMAVEPEITLASTTETQDELDHAVSKNWREPFDPDKAKTERETKDAEAAKAAKKPAGSAPADTRGTEGEGESEDDEPLPKGVQKRIDKYAGRAKAAEAKQKELETRLAALESKTTTITTTTPKEDLEPQKKDFKDPDEWIKAHGKWAAREVARESDARAEVEAADAHTQEVFDQHLERVNKFREEHDDFDEKVDAVTTTFSEAVAIAIVEADNGPDITYHLATHPEELEKISKMSRARQVMQIGILSASLSPSGSGTTTTTTTQRSRTPAPITSLKTTKTASSTTKLEDASTDDFIKMRNQHERDARRRR
jgi:hypothetical protein